MPYVIPTIFTAVDRFSRPVMGMQRAMAGLTNIGSVAGARLQRSLKSISSDAMEVATSAAMIGASVVIPLGLATKAAMDFEKQMANVSTIVDTTRESMSAMSDQVLQVASRVPVGISDLTESLYQIRSAGVSASDAMMVLETSAKLSVAGLSTATEATKAVTSALVAFKAQGLSATEIANSFFLTVKEGKTKMDAINESFGANAGFVASLGVKLQDFNALTAALTITGQTASEAQNGIAASLVGLEKPTGEMTKLYQQLNVSTGRALIDKFGNVGDAITAVTDAAKKANIEVPKLFSRNALKTVSNITGGAATSYKSNLAEQGSGKDALTTAYQKQLGTTAAQAQIAKNNLVTLGIRIGELLLPALTSLLKAITPIVQALSNFARSHRTITGLIVGGIATFGLFAVAISGISFAVYTVTKAIWLWSLAVKAIEFTMGLFNTVLAVSNSELVTSAYAAKGAAAGMAILNTTWKGLLITVSRYAVVLAGIYGIYKLLDKKSEATDKMAAIIPHLPQGVDKKKFQDQFQDFVSPGHISLMNRVKGVKSFYPQEMYDSLANKYYDEPKRVNDSTSSAQDSIAHMQSIIGGDSTSNKSQNSEQKVTVLIDNKTGFNVAVSGTGPINPKLKQTGSYGGLGMA